MVVEPFGSNPKEMKFVLRPILSEIKALYEQPRTGERFKEYLSKLQGTSQGDMQLPIVGFNPMAKEHVLGKISELEALEAEALMQKTIATFNQSLSNKSSETITVVLNLADDLKGAWTNYFTTDFDSKFKLNAFVQRRFCAPFFWTSEQYTEDKISRRTRDYLCRTMFFMEQGKPQTLADFFAQEVFVCQHGQPDSPLPTAAEVEDLKRFYEAQQKTDDYPKIFNFFYGDAAAESLAYPRFGIQGMTGFDYAQFVAAQGDEKD